jgi:hypothetical protein
MRVAGVASRVIPDAYGTDNNRFDHNGFGTSADFERCMIDCFDMLYGTGRENAEHCGGLHPAQ